MSTATETVTRVERIGDRAGLQRWLQQLIAEGRLAEVLGPAVPLDDGRWVLEVMVRPPRRRTPAPLPAARTTRPARPRNVTAPEPPPRTPGTVSNPRTSVVATVIFGTLTALGVSSFGLGAAGVGLSMAKGLAGVLGTTAAVAAAGAVLVLAVRRRIRRRRQ